MSKNQETNKFKPLQRNQLALRISTEYPDIDMIKAADFIDEYGYYHGYKGHCYDYEGNKFESISEIKKQIEFDIKLKNLLFPLIMLFERKFKQTVLDILIIYFTGIKNSKYFKNSATLNNLFKELFEINSDSRVRKKIFEVKDNLYHYFSTIYSSSYHQNFNVVHHYYDKYFELPIWAVFETIGINKVLEIIKCCPADIKKEIMTNIKMYNHIKYSEFQNRINQIFNLRNFVCHNAILLNINKEGKSVIKDYIETLLLGISAFNKDNLVNQFKEEFNILVSEYNIKYLNI